MYTCTNKIDLEGKNTQSIWINIFNVVKWICIAVLVCLYNTWLFDRKHIKLL